MRKNYLLFCVPTIPQRTEEEEKNNSFRFIYVIHEVYNIFSYVSLNSAITKNLSSTFGSLLLSSFVNIFR